MPCLLGRLRDVKASGLTMDVDHMSSIRVDKNNNRERWVAFNRATGAGMSAMEHLVPEEMYSTDDNPAHGISAVKALQLAAAEGQKIWTITQSNLSQAMAALNLSSSVEADIRNAVRAGKEVTAHEDTINFHGRPSAGYMVLDPKTGAGGYPIAGGENGSNTSTPDGKDVISWLLGILDEFGRNPLLKSLGGILNEVITAISLFVDIKNCGYSYGIAKFFAGIFITIGVAFLLLPFIALIMTTLYLALWASFFAGGVAASFFSAQWACKEEG